MASFKDCSKFIFKFSRLDNRITNDCNPSAYYQRWMKKYAEIFNKNTTALCIAEWDLRCKKALREMFASATFFVEAERDLKMRCYASYYFCLYYALFHALTSVILLDSQTKLSSILNITHRNLINIFLGSFATSKKDILDREIEQQYYDLQYRREYYSYVTPINNLFNYEKDLADLRETVLDCFQLAAFHSMMVDESYSKNYKKIEEPVIKTEDELYEFMDMFDRMFYKKAKPSAKRRSSTDPAVDNWKHELLRDGARPTYIALELDHQYDELHTYDGFYDDGHKLEEAVNAGDIYSLVYEVINE